MSGVDWKTVLSYTSEDLEELSIDEKNYLYEQLSWFDCENSKLDNKSWRSLFRVTQEVLRYKHDLVNIKKINEIK